MIFEVLPISELVKYLNQFDICNLLSVSKSFNRFFQSYQNEIKKYVETRATRLSVYISHGEEETKIYYTFGSSNKGEITVEPGQYVLYIVKKIIDKVPIKDGDVIKVNYDFIGEDFENYPTDVIFLYLNGNIVCDKHFTARGYAFEIPISLYSIYHWNSELNTVIFSLLNNVVFYYDNEGKYNYIEIILEKVRFRINCKKHLLTWLHELCLLVDYKK